MLLYWSLLPVSLRLCSMEWIYGKPSFQFLTRVTPLQRFERVYVCVHVCKKHYISFFKKGDQWARPGGGGGGGA